MHQWGLDCSNITMPMAVCSLKKSLPVLSLPTNYPNTHTHVSICDIEEEEEGGGGGGEKEETKIQHNTNITGYLLE